MLSQTGAIIGDARANCKPFRFDGRGFCNMDTFVTESVGDETYQYYPLGEHIVRASGVCGGRPTFKYTRIEISGALERLAAGETMDEIVAGYRGRVSHAALLEAVRLVTMQFITTLPQLELA